MLKAALVALSTRAPRGVSFDELAKNVAHKLSAETFDDSDRARLARNVLGLYTKGALRLWASDKPVARVAGDRPRAFAYARYQASVGSAYCTSLLHEGLQVDSFDRALLARMDGTQNVAALVAAVLDDARRGVVQVQMNGVSCVDAAVFEEVTERKLLLFAERGLLCDPESNALP